MGNSSSSEDEQTPAPKKVVTPPAKPEIPNLARVNPSRIPSVLDSIEKVAWRAKEARKVTAAQRADKRDSEQAAANELRAQAAAERAALEASKAEVRLEREALQAADRAEREAHQADERAEKEAARARALAEREATQARALAEREAARTTAEQQKVAAATAAAERKAQQEKAKEERRAEIAVAIRAQKAQARSEIEAKKLAKAQAKVQATEQAAAAKPLSSPAEESTTESSNEAETVVEITEAKPEAQKRNWAKPIREFVVALRTFFENFLVRITSRSGIRRRRRFVLGVSIGAGVVVVLIIVALTAFQYIRPTQGLITPAGGPPDIVSVTDKITSVSPGDTVVALLGVQPDGTETLLLGVVSSMNEDTIFIADDNITWAVQPVQIKGRVWFSLPSRP